jgi:hypothetical protein
MARLKAGVTHTIILWVAGTLITIVVFTGVIWPWLLSIWYGSCWADGRTDLKTFGNQMSMATSPWSPAKTERLTIGDCIAGVVFINANDEPLLYSHIIEDKCSEYDGFKSYMIALPREYLEMQFDDDIREKILKKHKELEDTLGKKLDELRKTLGTWEIITLYLKDKIGRVPPSYCYELEHPIHTDVISGEKKPVTTIPAGLDPLKKETWNTGKEPYCIKIEPVEMDVMNPDGSVKKDFTYKLTPVQCTAENK